VLVLVLALLGAKKSRATTRTSHYYGPKRGSFLIVLVVVVVLVLLAAKKSRATTKDEHDYEGKTGFFRLSV
jgi:hypothetical protein